MKITPKPCPLCNKTHELEVNESDYLKWQKGAYVQDVFRDQSAEFRELLISGTCSECWDRLFGEEL